MTKLGVSDDTIITVNYVTRAYVTRHGDCTGTRGPGGIVDETNVYSRWQGELRYANLDVDWFDRVTQKDFNNYAPVGSTYTTTITCVDQLKHTRDAYELDNSFNLQMITAFDYMSSGKTREDVKPNPMNRRRMIC